MVKVGKYRSSNNIDYFIVRFMVGTDFMYGLIRKDNISRNKILNKLSYDDIYASNTKKDAIKKLERDIEIFTQKQLQIN